MKPQGNWRLGAVVIVLGAWLAYRPVLRGGWLWDDDREVSQNPVLREAGGLGKIWTGPVGADYLPLKSTVQWAEWRIWGDDVLGYHLTNLALHLASALLFWRLLRRLGLPLAWLGGLILAIHPLAVESVAWISELKNTLSLALLLPAMLAYLDYEEGRLRFYWLSLFCFLLAMLAKSSVAMFPGVLLLHAWWRRGRITWSDLKASAPYFVVSGSLGLVTVWLQWHRALLGPDLTTDDFLSRVAGAGLVATFYLWKFVWPAGLLPIYPRWELNPPSALQLLPGLLWVVLLRWLWTKRSGWGRHALFGLGFFALNLLPVSGFLPMAYLRISRVADHLAYLPMLGAIGMATGALGWAWQAVGVISRGPGFRLIFSGAVAAGALLLVCRSRAYAQYFRSQQALWSYTLQSNPDAWEAHKSLSQILLQQGDVAQAIAHGEAAVRLKPEYAEAHNNLANALAAAGREPEAIAQYEAAVQLSPGIPNLHRNLGDALAASGHRPEAVEQYWEALRLDANDADTLYNLGTTLLLLHRPQEAIGQFEAALRLAPGTVEAQCNLGAAFAELGQLEPAADHFAEAIRLNPGLADAQRNLASVLVKLGRTGDAISHYEAAVRLDPADVRTRRELDRLLRPPESPKGKSRTEAASGAGQNP